jgi:hypothetical protein
MTGTPVKPGFVRLAVKLAPGRPLPTPGDLVKLSGVALEHLGPIAVEPGQATVEVEVEASKVAREALARLGLTQVVDWHWRWLKISLGRNHGLTLNQLKKLLAAADAGRLGKINLNNTHSLVGIQDYRLPQVVAKLSSAKLNGYAVRPEALPPGQGPGSPAFEG